MDEEKRNIAPWLSGVLAIDRKLTENFVRSVEKLMPMRQLQIHYKVLEISCHGVIWFASILALIWILNRPSLFQVQVNLLIGLLLDVVIVGILKALTRRRRPAINDDPLALGPDKYSFPSGHASRAMLLFYFFYYLWPLPTLFHPSLLAWVVAISLSRLLMRRHYILDISAGLVIGYAEGILMSILYLEPETCSNLVSWITDEKMEGTEGAET
ncbi:polyisoprenoid diphosphate/phosphate phosphohydrolase PLPP6 [Augochlora pura]